MIGEDGIWREEGESVTFYGPCPFIGCLVGSQHDHPICKDCGAVNHGNLTCPTCRQNMRSRGLVSSLLASLDAAGLATMPPVSELRFVDGLVDAVKLAGDTDWRPLSGRKVEEA